MQDSYDDPFNLPLAVKGKHVFEQFTCAFYVNYFAHRHPLYP